MPILLGIDGTGEAVNPGAERDRLYDIAFANSFVRRMCAGKPNAHYIRGPVALGGGVLEAVAEGVTFIQNARRIRPNEPILLTGYSRGAAEAVVVAERLKRLNINVRALMMFDCVDRAGDIDAETIPANVANVCHVIRNPAARSRLSFGNDGMQHTPATNYPSATMFMCTHGGMGGTPWVAPPGTSPNTYINEGSLEATAALFSTYRTGAVWNYRTNVTYAQDKAVSNAVWNHVQPFLRTHGF